MKLSEDGWVIAYERSQRSAVLCDVGWGGDAAICQKNSRPESDVLSQVPTGWSKKADPLHLFGENFRKCAPILTIFVLLHQEIHST